MHILSSEFNKLNKSSKKQVTINKFSSFNNRDSVLNSLMDLQSNGPAQISLDIDLLNELKDDSKDVNMEKFKCLQLNGEYTQKANALYCYGMTFILLHELSHFALGHLDKTQEDIEEEKNADLSVFWDLYNDITDKNERFTANCGILCTLFSLLMLNPKMDEDDIHPREADRIMYIYNQIKDDNYKYSLLLVHLFKYWTQENKIDGFPEISYSIDNNEIKKIETFLSTFKSI